MKITLISTLLMLFTGCTVIRPVLPETGHYFINPSADIRKIDKVVVIQLKNNTKRKQLHYSITNALVSALQKRHIFTVTSLDTQSDTYKMLNLTSENWFSVKEMARMKQLLKADAVIYGQVTQNRNYPHMLIGLHLKMLDLNTGQIAWGMEQLWDSTDKRLEYRMRTYFQEQMRTGYQPLNWQIVYTSPRHFRKFVTYEVAQTFPSQNFYNPRLSSEKNKYFRKKPSIIEKTKKLPAETLKFGQDISTIRL
jgi:hypothetical protein